jgi:hypothetical protein
MVRLELTRSETDLLQQWLTDTLSDRLAQPAQLEGLHTILSKLTLAADQATRQLHCPVCRHAFTQEKAGRTGRYCSIACKQKAYRQRQLAARKQFGPTPKH